LNFDRIITFYVSYVKSDPVLLFFPLHAFLELSDIIKSSSSGLRYDL
jgi:hypothetical protein